MRHPPPALLVLDLMLPGMDGFDLLDLLRRERRLTDTRLVVVTARELTETERHFLTGEGGTILAKGPGFREALLAALPGKAA
jgi:CheY-like chemotaxis protein